MTWDHPARLARCFALVALMAPLSSTAAFAQQATGAGSMEAAAARYDEGVLAFDRGEFARAASAFIAADELAPSGEALANALTSAVRAGDHLAVVRIAERTTARAGVDQQVVTQARLAHTYAASKLARLLLSCEPKPCGLALDGAVVQPGVRYALPGSYTLVAVARDGHRSSRQLELTAGTSYRIQMYATAAGEAARTAELEAERGKVVARPAPGNIIREFPTDAPEPAADSWRTLPPWVFFTGVGLSTLAVGLTAVSGVDALSARDELSARPSVSERDAVAAKITRTDVLVGVSVGLAALTTYLGVFHTKWGRAEVSLGPGWVSGTGRF